MVDRQQSQDISRVDSALLAALLPHPAADANKYSRGRAVLIAGSARYAGAAVLCSRAAQRAGAGYTMLFSQAERVEALQMTMPSVVVAPWDDFAEKVPFYQGKCAVGIGSGMDARNPQTAELLCAALASTVPVVVDGGALDALATPAARTLLEARAGGGVPTVITPHAGEAARLVSALGLGCGDVADNPVGTAVALSQALFAVTVLKGPITYIAEPDGTVSRMDEGTPALAKAGTGDVLCGLLTGLMAQGLAAADAAKLAAAVHARAGVLAAEAATDIAVLPEEILDAIPRAISAW